MCFVVGKKLGLRSDGALDRSEPCARRREIAEREVGESSIKRIARGVGVVPAAGVRFDGAQFLHRLRIAAVLVSAYSAAERWRTANGEEGHPGRERRQSQKSQKGTIVHSPASDVGRPSFVPRRRFVPW